MRFSLSVIPAVLTLFAGAASASVAKFNALDAFAGAYPSLQGREVYDPPILQPTAGSKWAAGSTQTVKWDPSSVPPNSNTTGIIMLGWQEDAEGSEHLDFRHPLASGFPLIAGAVKVKLPNVKPRTDYIVVLLGDSGNASPQFTITKP